MLRWLKTVVVSDVEKAHEMRQVGIGKTVRSPRLGIAVDVSLLIRWRGADPVTPLSCGAHSSRCTKHMAPRANSAGEPNRCSVGRIRAPDRRLTCVQGHVDQQVGAKGHRAEQAG